MSFLLCPSWSDQWSYKVNSMHKPTVIATRFAKAAKTASNTLMKAVSEAVNANPCPVTVFAARTIRPTSPSARILRKKLIRPMRQDPAIQARIK